MILKNCGKSVKVDTLHEASRLVRKTIKETDMGSTRWYGFMFNGFVFDGDKQVAHISYNGRIWQEETV